MAARALLTGGAGFIGSHLTDELLRHGYAVRVLDALLPQVHPRGRPDHLSGDAELVVGDVRDGSLLARLLGEADFVVHLAAAVGVGQSMYEIGHYCSVNVMGTATLLEVLVKEGIRPRRLVVASSMSIYGEGLYGCERCGPHSPGLRPPVQLARADWAQRCPRCSSPMDSRPTPEDKPLRPSSVYAVNKRDQEEMALSVAASLGIPAVALRFFNVYGERQALSNPYTGVAAIFSSALLNRRRPLVFEDGRQQRDFVHVCDVARACRLALEREDVAGESFNIGTGRPTSLLELLELLRREIPAALDLEPEILGRYREGDVRACYADLTRARQRLGFEPAVPLERGVRSLAAWVASQRAEHRAGVAFEELRRYGLVR